MTNPKNRKRRSESLSARRAWIEISPVSAPYEAPTTSLSARRAWIEILVAIIPSNFSNVALRKESVDRNLGHGVFVFVLGRRSPQGERG